jgi:hypothetical protein
MNHLTRRILICLMLLGFAPVNAHAVDNKSMPGEACQGLTPADDAKLARWGNGAPFAGSVAVTSESGSRTATVSCPLLRGVLSSGTFNYVKVRITGAFVNCSVTGAISQFRSGSTGAGQTAELFFANAAAVSNEPYILRCDLTDYGTGSPPGAVISYSWEED